MADSNNALTAFNKEYWASEMQVIFFKENVAIALANMDLRETLTDGDTVNRPYTSKPFPKTYTKGADITVKDTFSTNEQLSVATTKVVPFYVDDIDSLQNKWDWARTNSQRAQRVLNNILDQYHNNLGVAGATSYIDDGSVGGSAGTNITISVSNVDTMFSALAEKMDSLSIPGAGRYCLVGPRWLSFIRRYIGGKETSFGDIVGANGKVMNRFGFELYYTNNNYFTASCGIATNPTAADTVTINGAILEFVAAPDADEAAVANIGVDIGGSAAVSVDNLVAAVNDAGTEGTTYGTYDAGNMAARWKLINCGCVATDGTTAMTIVAYGDVILSETFTDTTDAWSSETSYILAGLKRFSVDIVIQKSPTVVFKEDPDRLGRNVFPWMLFGGKVWLEHKDTLVYGKINASDWT